VILDRSVYSDWVFAEQNRRDGTISEAGFNYYIGLRKKMLDHLPIPPVTLYLNCTAETCFDRVHHMRGRVRHHPCSCCLSLIRCIVVVAKVVVVSVSATDPLLGILAI
jgi:deoxynucleoside kinase